MKYKYLELLDQVVFESNYAVTYNDGELSISQRPITIRADRSKTYGESLSGATAFSVTSGSLANSETLSSRL